MPEMTLRVLDKANGGELAGAEVAAYLRARDRFSGIGKFGTDNRGRCRVPLPESGIPMLILTVFCDTYVPRSVRWFVDQGDDLPEEYTLELERGTNIGGIIRNERGANVAGAKITLEWAGRSYQPFAREWPALHRDWFFLSSDSKGIWKCGFAPVDLAEITLRIEHPDYAQTLCHVAHRPYLHESQLVSKQALLDGRGLMILTQGFALAGHVRGPTGRPVARAKVTFNQENAGLRPESTSTDERGHFVFPHCPMMRLVPSTQPGCALDRFKPSVTVEADGFSIAVRRLALEGTAPHLEIQLEKATPLKDSLTNLRLTIPADRRELVGVMEPVARVFGKVLDRASGQSVARFMLFPLTAREIERADDFWPRHCFFGKNGAYDIAIPEAEVCALRVEADGYFAETMACHPEPGAHGELDFALQRLSHLEGVIVLPDGQPAAGAHLCLGKAKDMALLEGATLQVFAPRRKVHQTDGRGHFAIPWPSPTTRSRQTAPPKGMPREEYEQVVAAHESGFAEATPAEVAATGRMTLAPWGRVEGMFLGESSAPHLIQLNRVVGPDQSTWRFARAQSQITDALFAFSYVPAGPYKVSRTAYGNGMEAVTHELVIEVAAGRSTRVRLDRGGQLIIGKITEPVRRIDSSGCQAWLLRKPDPQSASCLVAQTHEISFAGRGAHRVLPFQPGKYPVFISPDGSFRIEDVPAGEYLLSFTWREPLEGESAWPEKPGSPLTKTVMVAATETLENGPLDLGTLVWHGPRLPGQK